MKEATRNAILPGAAISSAVIVLALWVGVPAIKKANADKMVDELCSKDGGVRIFRTVEIPANSERAPAIPPKKLRKEGDEFYFIHTGTDIVGKLGSKDISALTVFRFETKLYRAKDDELLGEAVMYGRRGGDAPGPWHPSHYRCPSQDSTAELVRQALIQHKR